MIRNFLGKVKPLYWFVLLILLMAFLYDYHQIIVMKPCGIHQWRSCVSAAFSLNFYHGGSFFHPQTNMLLADNFTSDITVVEFPLIYWIISLLYRIFGVNEFWFRLVQVSIGFMGLIYLFKASYILTKDWFYAGVIPMIVFTSPIYVFYINGFIPDAAALSLTFGGFYYFLRFSKNKRTSAWYLSMGFFVLAGLAKTSSMLPYFAIGGVAAIDLLQASRGKEKSGMFIFTWKHILAYSSVLILIIGWYYYARIYSDVHGGSVSAVELRPIWKMEHDRLMQSWEAMKLRFHERDYHYPWFLVMTLVVFIGMLPFYRKSNRFLYFLNIFLITGALAFTLLFFFDMKDHDYYQINNLFVLVSIWLAFFTLMAKQRPNLYSSPWPKLAVALIVVGLWYSCDRNMRWRYHEKNWHFWYSNLNISRFGIEDYLQEIGVDRSKKVYCTPDPSINISLYLCNRKGLTDYGPMHKLSMAERVDSLRVLGVDYIILGDREIYKDVDNLDQILGVKVGEIREAEIFKIVND